MVRRPRPLGTSNHCSTHQPSVAAANAAMIGTSHCKVRWIMTMMLVSCTAVVAATTTAATTSRSSTSSGVNQHALLQINTQITTTQVPQHQEHSPSSMFVPPNDCRETQWRLQLYDLDAKDSNNNQGMELDQQQQVLTVQWNDDCSQGQATHSLLVPLASSSSSSTTTTTTSTTTPTSTTRSSPRRRTRTLRIALYQVVSLDSNNNNNNNQVFVTQQIAHLQEPHNVVSLHGSWKPTAAETSSTASTTVALWSFFLGSAGWIYWMQKFMVTTLLAFGLLFLVAYKRRRDRKRRYRQQQQELQQQQQQHQQVLVLRHQSDSDDDSSMSSTDTTSFRTNSQDGHSATISMIRTPPFERPPSMERRSVHPYLATGELSFVQAMERLKNQQQQQQRPSPRTLRALQLGQLQQQLQMQQQQQQQRFLQQQQQLLQQQRQGLMYPPHVVSSAPVSMLLQQQHYLQQQQQQQQQQQVTQGMAHPSHPSTTSSTTQRQQGSWPNLPTLSMGHERMPIPTMQQQQQYHAHPNSVVPLGEHVRQQQDQQQQQLQRDHHQQLRAAALSQEVTALAPQEHAVGKIQSSREGSTDDAGDKTQKEDSSSHSIWSVSTSAEGTRNDSADPAGVVAIDSDSIPQQTAGDESTVLAEETQMNHKPPSLVSGDKPRIDGNVDSSAAAKYVNSELMGQQKEVLELDADATEFVQLNAPSIDRSDKKMGVEVAALPSAEEANLLLAPKSTETKSDGSEQKGDQVDDDGHNKLSIDTLAAPEESTGDTQQHQTTDESPPPPSPESLVVACDSSPISKEVTKDHIDGSKPVSESSSPTAESMDCESSGDSFFPSCRPNDQTPEAGYGEDHSSSPFSGEKHARDVLGATMDNNSLSESHPPKRQCVASVLTPKCTEEVPAVSSASAPRESPKLCRSWPPTQTKASPENTSSELQIPANTQPPLAASVATSKKDGFLQLSQAKDPANSPYSSSLDPGSESDEEDELQHSNVNKVSSEERLRTIRSRIKDNRRQNGIVPTNLSQALSEPVGRVDSKKSHRTSKCHSAGSRNDTRLAVKDLSKQRTVTLKDTSKRRSEPTMKEAKSALIGTMDEILPDVTLSVALKSASRKWQDDAWEFEGVGTGTQSSPFEIEDGNNSKKRRSEQNRRKTATSSQSAESVPKKNRRSNRSLRSRADIRKSVKRETKQATAIVFIQPSSRSRQSTSLPPRRRGRKTTSKADSMAESTTGTKCRTRTVPRTVEIPKEQLDRIRPAVLTASPPGKTDKKEAVESSELLADLVKPQESTTPALTAKSPPRAVVSMKQKNPPLSPARTNLWFDASQQQSAPRPKMLSFSLLHGDGERAGEFTPTKSGKTSGKEDPFLFTSDDDNPVA